MSLAVSARRLAGFCAVSLSLAAVPSFAQDDNVTEGHLSAARAAIAATHITDRFDNILPAAAMQLKNDLLQKNPDMESVIDSTVDDKTLSMASRRGDLEREAALAYARVFSEDELKAIAQFYNTPVGQKLLDKGPAVSVEVYKAAEIWQRGVARDLAQSVSETLDAKMPKPAPAPTSDQQPAPAPAKTK